jgi:hypothetical protein
MEGINGVYSLTLSPKRTDLFLNLFSYLQSAGGQTLQRWALLSNSYAWNSMDIRVVVANARSYAYLDGRRWMAPNPEDGPDDDQGEVFRLPDPNDGIDSYCPQYNHWLWGLEDGGEVQCPYRDREVAEVDSAAAIAKRYALRNVVSPEDSLHRFMLGDGWTCIWSFYSLSLTKTVLTFQFYDFVSTQTFQSLDRSIYQGSTTRFPNLTIAAATPSRG